MRSTLALQDLNDTQLVMLQVIAHDLRNPIGGAAQYVRRHLAPEGVDLQAKREAILVLGKTLAETDELLENLLMWAHDRTGLSKAREPVDLDLDALLRSQIDLLAEAAREKGLDLKMEEGGLHILAEPNGSAVILRNILSNALKFTPPGGKVTAKTRLGPRGVEVAICDTGLGMDEARIAAFRAGRELPSSPGTAGERGSGLGLSLCKRFMEDQGGLLEVESRLGAGSTFTLVFPAPEKKAILKA
jgi:signal transduction histidine kinase